MAMARVDMRYGHVRRCIQASCKRIDGGIESVEGPPRADWAAEQHSRRHQERQRRRRHASPAQAGCVTAIKISLNAIQSDSHDDGMI